MISLKMGTWLVLCSSSGAHRPEAKFLGLTLQPILLWVFLFNGDVYFEYMLLIRN